MASEPATLEAQCRTLMAKRANIALTWDHRAERALLANRIDTMLDRWLLTVQCEAMA
jgi:hypothetical protein